MKKFRQINRLNRADLIKAFSGPLLTRQETMEIVNRYMGASPVPPAWSYASVRGVFGKHVARLWAKRLRHRPAGVYRDAETGRVLHPVTQTAYDFGTTPEAMREAAARLAREPRPLPEGMLIVLDEFHMN